MKKTLFLVFSACMVAFSIISICTAPIINGVLQEASQESWKTLNCKKAEDDYKNSKTDNLKKLKNKCNRQKAMYGLEYSSLILDVTLGFICAVLGLLHYFDVAKPFEKVSGIIGLSTGVISFVLTLVYTCYSGYIFTNQIPTHTYDSSLGINFFKVNKDGAIAKKDGNQFKCLYFKSNKVGSGIAKFSDLGNSALNYQKKRYYADNDSKYVKCALPNDSSALSTLCSSLESIAIPAGNDCDYIYLNSKAAGFGNKYLFDMWVTTIIFSCFICVCAIGLAIFGFSLFKNDGSGI